MERQECDDLVAQIGIRIAIITDAITVLVPIVHTARTTVQVRAKIACVADPIVILVMLVWIGDVRAVVYPVDYTVAIAIAMFRVKVKPTAGRREHDKRGQDSAAQVPAAYMGPGHQASPFHAGPSSAFVSPSYQAAANRCRCSASWTAVAREVDDLVAHRHHCFAGAAGPSFLTMAGAYTGGSWRSPDARGLR